MDARPSARADVVADANTTVDASSQWMPGRARARADARELIEALIQSAGLNGCPAERAGGLPPPRSYVLEMAVSMDARPSARADRKSKTWRVRC